MKKQRFLAMLLSIVLLVGSLPINIFAVDNTASEAPVQTSSSSTIVYAKDAYGKAGTVVDMDIVISQNPGILGITLKLEYDESVLTLISINSGDAFNNMTFTSPKGDALKSGCILPWDTESIDEGDVKDGVIATLTFEISETTIAGTSTSVKLSCIDAIDGNTNSINVLTAVGTMKFLEYTPGDVNEDGNITTTDVVYLRRYIAGGYGVSINELAADVNGDGALTTTDVVYLRRYIAGGYGVELKPALQKCDHDLSKVNAKEATCTESGNIAYWQCSQCDKYFGDENAEKEISTVVIGAKGHTEETIFGYAPTYDAPGLTDGKKCSVCGEITVEQTEIPQNQPEYYSITYYDEKIEGYPKSEQYVQHEQLILPKLSKDGYKFEGWFTGVDGTGEKVVLISAGNTENKILYAHWSLIEYTITYKRYESAPDADSTKTTYNVETPTFKLSDSYWTGLSFAYWTKDGEKITQIEQGTTGNITLVANWKYKENLSVPTNKNIPMTLYDDTEGRYHFIYELGVVDTVVLEIVKTHDKDYDNNGEPLNWTTSESSSMEESIAKNVATTIGQNISKTTEWENARQTAHSYSNTESWNMSAEGSFKFLEAIGIKISGSAGGSTTNENSFSYSTVNGNSENVGSETVNTFQSNVSYAQSSEMSVTESFSVAATMPMGKYTYAYVGTVKVYVILTYDPDTEYYHIDTYTSIEDAYRSTTLYEPSGDMINKVNIVSNDPLKFNLEQLEDLKTFIDSSWYKIQYDSNGGEGEMPETIMYCGIEQPLHTNQFVRDGYTFVGWKYQNETDIAIYDDNMSVSDLAGEGETIVLEAVWSANPYTVTFDVNGGDALDPSTRVVTFGEKYGKDGSLPKPTRIGYSFDGWYCGNDCVTDDTIVSFASNHNLTAKWIPKTYTIFFDGNGGTVSQSIKEVVCGEAYGELPVAEKYGHNFNGWFTEQTGGIQITADSLVESSENETITLYAQWSPKTYRVGIVAHTYSWTKYVKYGDKLSFDLSAQSNFGSVYKFQAWYYANKGEIGVGTCSTDGLISQITTSTSFTITVNESTPIFGNSIYIAAYMTEATEDECLTGDTLVTLADGTQVRVDSLTGKENLLVWNMETGMLDKAPVMFVDSEEEAEYEVIKLYFSDGTEVKVISEHGFWDYDLNKYVYLDENASDYIGHSFAKQNGDNLERVQLIDVVIENEVTTAWSPVTVGHLCYFVNGMLSMPGGVGGLFNIFDVDPETMTYNYEAVQSDIETYGLYTYEELNALCPLSEEMFNAAGGAYLKISIGKGNLTEEELVNMINRYSKYFN